MSVFEQSQPGSFRGFNVLFESTRTQAGRNTATHEFVNSDNRDVEDLGRFPPKYSPVLIIHGPDALQQRDAFQNILDKPGTGILVHPTWGRQTVTVEDSYEIVEKDDEFGVYRFSVTFATSSGPQFPQQAAPTSSTIFSQELSTRSSIATRIEEQWAIPTTSLSNTDAADKLTDFADQTLEAFQGRTQDLTELTRVVNTIDLTANSIVRSPFLVAEAFTDVFEALDAISPESLQTLQSIKELFDFGNDDVPISNDFGLSVDQQNRQNNRELINASVQAAALLKAYTTSTLVDFQIVSRLDTNRAELYTQQREVVDTIQSAGNVFDASAASGVFINATTENNILNGILDQGSEANRIFDDQEENLYRLTTVRQNLTSTRLLSYALFEDEDEQMIIEDLNNTQRPSALMGDIEALNQ